MQNEVGQKYREQCPSARRRCRGGGGSRLAFLKRKPEYTYSGVLVLVVVFSNVGPIVKSPRDIGSPMSSIEYM